MENDHPFCENGPKDKGGGGEINSSCQGEGAKQLRLRATETQKKIFGLN